MMSLNMEPGTPARVEANADAGNTAAAGDRQQLLARMEALNMIDNITVGKTIAKLRQNKNMTQQQLAAALNVSHQAVSKWETGAALPDVQTLMALTRLFGITMEQLLNGEVPEDRVEAAKPASPFDEPIQNIGNFVNNIVNGIFRPEKKDPDGAPEAGEAGAEATEPDGEDADGACDAEANAAPEAVEAFDVQRLLQMAPFMSKEAVDEIVLENKEKLSAGDIARFAPYVSQECLEKLIHDSEEQINWDTLRRVAPFLKRETVDQLAKTAAQNGDFVKRCPTINTEEIGRTVQDVSQKIGAGVEKAIRKAAKLGSDVAEGVSSAINGIVDSAREKQQRADALRRAA